MTTSIKIPLLACLAAVALVSAAHGQQDQQSDPAASAGGNPQAAPGDSAAGSSAEPSQASETPGSESAPADEPAASASEPEQPPPAEGSAISEPGAHTVRLRELEQRVNELKERVFRSKARLNLLKETVLHGVIAGSRAIIRHKNEMGSAFRLVQLIYAVDGTQILSKGGEDGGLDGKREFQVFSGSIVPGNHTISVQMVFQGHGYGIFSYLKGYRFTVKSSHTFTAGEGRQTVITVRAYEKGNVTTELKDRPAIKFETNLYKVGKKQPASKS